VEEASEMGMPSQILELLKCIYRENTSCVKVHECLTRPFQVTMGLHKGCSIFTLTISQPLFSDAHGEVGFGEMSISWLLYADGLIMLAETK